MRHRCCAVRRNPPDASPPSPWNASGTTDIAGLGTHTYDVAVYTVWTTEYRSLVRAAREVVFDRSIWLAHGDSACVEESARALGWIEPLPAPFVMTSQRRFGVPPGTVALHPGCKPDWPWKKWHGFAELAARLPHVAIVGTPSDVDNRDTYFNRDFVWPPHARSFIGALDLPDTVALLSECAALVSNDSGLMHAGVALGLPTYGIFGITNPAREAIPVANMIPVEKGLACEPACRRGSWGRRDCERHLECLRTLSAADVLAAIGRARTVMRDAVNVTYYGHVFDASGYGEAARWYIHALHGAGVSLSVVDLMNHGRQVRDPLVESLLNRPLTPDFHLFHGIPPQWARLAFPLANAIGMTVWETDTVPSQWHGVLNHVVDLWLPSVFNVDTFGSGLGRSAFRLPHPVVSRHVNGERADIDRLTNGREDFVFYSIFEWQDGKGPWELLLAYFRAFRDCGETQLVLKINPGAADAAAAMVDQTRRETGSTARVLVVAAAWTPARSRRSTCAGIVTCRCTAAKDGDTRCSTPRPAACRRLPPHFQARSTTLRARRRTWFRTTSSRCSSAMSITRRT